ncbi:MAG TPA: hypothetical protein VLH56_06165, partial [Dissulfurispiraceae bacterium]|nr:hypothetical protein [Dissulfurispiraceae bacterium]
MERFKGFTDSQVSDFWRAATKAGFQSGPWYEARRYSGPSVTVHYELSFKRGWFSKSQVAVGEDCEAMQNIADCIADTPQYCDGSLSVQMGHWEIHSGHFAVVKKYVFRGGSRDVIISVLAPAGVGEAAIDAELGKENEKVVGYVLSSKADDVQTLVKSMEARLLRPIPPDLHVALMERVKEVCNARPYDEAGFARMVHQVVLRHVGCNGIHTSQLVSEYLELPVTNGTAVHKACDTRGLCFLQLLTELLSGSLHEGVAVATAFEDPWLDAA